MAASHVPAGIECVGPPTACYPSYLRAARGLDAGMPETPFVMYGVAQTIAADGAEVLAEVGRSVLQPHLRAFQLAPARAGRSGCRRARGGA